MKGIAVSVTLSLIVLCSAPAYSLDSPESWYERGATAEASQQYESALQAYAEAVRLDPSHADALFRRGALLFKLSPTRAVEARRDLSRALALDPEMADAFYERARIHFFALNNDAARQDMLHAAGLGHEGARAFLETPPSAVASRYVHLGAYLAPERPPVVYFPLDEAGLDDASKELLAALAAVLRKDLPDVAIYIAGHTDNQGAASYNQDLSLRRAEAVKAFLLDHGVLPAHRMVVRAYGEGRPFAPNDSEEGRTLNRRVEIMALRR